MITNRNWHSCNSLSDETFLAERERERETERKRAENWKTERNCFVQSCQILKHEINIKRATVTAVREREGEN